MQPVGASGAIMGKSGAPPKRPHIKYVGVQAKTYERYRAAFQQFSIYLTSFGLPFPNSLDQLDYVLGEYLN